MNNNFHQFINIINNPIKYRLFLLKKLPLGLFTGLKIDAINQQNCSVQIRYKWLNKNPFNSIYFAAQSMAAELSTGVLAFAYIYNQSTKVSMLVTNVNGSFYKKATGKIIFTCLDGDKIKNAIQNAINTNEAQTIECTSFGKNEKNDVVANFTFTWSFKTK